MNNKFIYFLLVLCVMFWSGNFIIGRYIKDDIDVMEMVFFRWVITLIIIFPILVIKYKKIIYSLKNNFIILIILSFLGIALFNTIIYMALHTTTSTNALIINSSVPLLILIYSFIIFKQKIQRIQISGIILSTIGVLYIVLKGSFLDIFNLHFSKGDLWVVLAALTWALYSALVKLKPKDLDGMEFFSIIVLLGFIMILPFYFLKGYTLQEEIEVFENNYLVFLYISIFPSVLSYYIWNSAISKIGANKTGQFTHLMPIFGIFFAYVFLDEVFYSYNMIGAILIAIGIYLSLFYKK